MAAKTPWAKTTMDKKGPVIQLMLGRRTLCRLTPDQARACAEGLEKEANAATLPKPKTFDLYQRVGEGKYQWAGSFTDYTGRTLDSFREQGYECYDELPPESSIVP